MKEYFRNIICIAAASGAVSLICKGVRHEKLLERITSLCLICACFLPFIGQKIETFEVPAASDFAFESCDEVIIRAGANICSTVEAALLQIYGVSSKVTAELDVSDKSNIVIKKVSVLCDGGNSVKIENTVSELVGGCEVEVTINKGNIGE